MTTLTYDYIFELLSKLTLPSTDGPIEVEWLVEHRLAVGRDKSGRFMLVMTGSPVHAASDIVSRALVSGTWALRSGDSISGTILRLPFNAQFHVATTTIAVEFVRHGVSTRPVTDVFPEVEPFIELVIRRVLLPPEAILGLIGELMVLQEVQKAVAQIPEEARPDPCSIWKGHSRNSRDFSLNALALEVKTTTAPSSIHHIGGLDQIEPRRVDDDLTESLYLISVGLTEETAGSSPFSVAQLADAILGAMEPDEQARFLDKLRKYGPDDCAGYDHDEMSTWDVYTRRYRRTFVPRTYDMQDDKLRLIRRSDLDGTCVLAAGISYRVELPEVVPGSHGTNPRTNMGDTLLQLIGSQP